jgi:hypothetical protein
VTLAAGALTGCGSAAKAPEVPSLPGAATSSTPSAGASGGAGNAGNGKSEPRATGAAGDNSDARRHKLHDAADCVRKHGIPTYRDPVLTADGHVYTDARSYQDASDAALTAVDAACGVLMAAAQFTPTEQAPAPPKLVQAGVKVAQCLRAHGLTDVTDPTSTTMFTPGHGFGMTGTLPPGGKDNPVVKAALDACRTQIKEETRLSSMESLAGA